VSCGQRSRSGASVLRVYIDGFPDGGDGPDSRPRPRNFVESVAVPTSLALRGTLVAPGSISPRSVIQVGSRAHRLPLHGPQRPWTA